MNDKKSDFRAGVKCGLPIAVGYFACALTLGVMARTAGLSVPEAVIASLCLNASAGEYAFFEVIAEGGSLITMMLMEAIANARYALMSCVIGQKAGEKVRGLPRFLIGFDLTDELFSAAVSRESLTFAFYGGMMTVSMPGWALGTAVGFYLGNVLPPVVLSAFSIALFGMFITAVVPAAKKDKRVLILSLLTMAGSYALFRVPALSAESGIRTVLVTVVLSLIFALLFPISDEEAKDA